MKRGSTLTSHQESIPIALTFPEIVELICSTLTPESIIIFKQTCSTLLNTIQSTSTLDALLQPLLNDLKKMALHLSLSASQGKENTAWRGPLFHRLFMRIANDQWDEIQHFQQCVVEEIIQIDIVTQAKLHSYDGPITKLSTLTVVDNLLNDINASLIAGVIDNDINATSLDVSSKGLTRFPQQLFDNLHYAHFWSNLQELFCQENQLQTLPESLGQCGALQTLRCDQNKLQVLPETLGECIALENLYCHKNQLRALPETLGQCVALQELYCEQNQLQALLRAMCCLARTLLREESA